MDCRCPGWDRESAHDDDDDDDDIMISDEGSGFSYKLLHRQLCLPYRYVPTGGISVLLPFAEANWHSGSSKRGEATRALIWRH